MRANKRDQRSAVLLDSLRKRLRRGATVHLLNLLQRIHPGDVPPIFNVLTDTEQHEVLKLLLDKDITRAADVATALHPTAAAQILARFEVPDISRLLQLCSSDDAAEIVATMPEDLRENVLSQMRQEEGEDVQDLLSYPEETAGRIMSPNFFALPEGTSAGDAMKALRGKSDVEMVFYLYVTDERNHLLGVVSMRQLILVEPDTPIKNIMMANIVSVKTDTDQEEVAKLVSKYDFLAVPVVDDQNKLMGIITVDDVIDVIREEATEDFYKLAGTSDQERLQRSTLIAARHRLPWLTVSLVEGVLAVSIFASFQEWIQPMYFLVGFLPMLVGMGGNIGTQSATIVVRGLATGRFALKEIGAVLLREVQIAGILGAVYGVVLSVASYFFLGDIPFRAAPVIGASIFLIMILAAAVGSFLPMVCARISVDPTIATGPFLTSLMDILGMVVYFEMVKHFLPAISAG
ncbi:MAG TPA: magnesium transporter [Verrucomicrobiae bacterium]|nr:magnesium transporter [Verrucomicrobiae bacterium]